MEVVEVKEPVQEQPKEEQKKAPEEEKKERDMSNMVNNLVTSPEEIRVINPPP